MSDINIPVIGRTDKKMAIALGIGAVVVIGVGYYRYRQSKNAATATPTGAGIDSSTIDPATGFVYGSAEDAAALQNQGGYIQPGATNATVETTGVTTTQTFTNNAQWSQAATDYLTNTVGLDGPTVSAALGAYLTGAGLDSSGASIIHQAIAAEGQPPQSGLNGFPPSIQTIATPPASATPPPPPSQVGQYLGGQYYYLVSAPPGGKLGGQSGFTAGSHWEVVNGKRYKVSSGTWGKIKSSGVLPKGGPWYKEVTASDPIFKLPYGGTI